MRRTARLLVLLFLSLSLLFSFIPFAYAQEPYDPYANLNTNPDVPKNLHTLTQGVVMGLGSSITCMLAGVDPLGPNGKCLGIDPKTKKIGYVESNQNVSAVGFMSNMITALYTPPAHTSEYFQYLSQNFGITKTAYAQATPPLTGTGFQGIAPLATLWVTFRNIAYLFFVIVFTIIGIAIMLRIKIDPRTVMSIENQIPKLIIGIILVTLSFPIAGFMIDLMWVLTYLVIAILNPIILAANPSSIPPINIFSNPTGFLESMTVKVLGSNQSGFWGIVANGAGTIKDMVNGMLPHLSNIWEPLTNFAIIGDFFKAVLGIVVSLVAFLIITIMLLFALLKLWIALLKAYVGILLDIVFAPFWIIAGALPGSPLGFGAWIKSLLANLLPFPATIAMLMLGNIFMQAFSTKPNVFAPPMLGISGGDPGVIGTIIGIGMILLTSQVTSIIKDAFKSPSLKYASAIGQSFGASTGLIKTTAGTVGTGIWGSSAPGKSGFPAVLRRLAGI